MIILLAGCSDSERASTQASRPNVVFIVIDDLNDYPGTFGGHPQAKTPNIDKLAKSGVIFTNAHSNSPICSPSRNSLFTGVYPHDSRDFDWTPHFDLPALKNNKTIMELFRENGYHVAGTGKILHVDRKEYWDDWGVDVDYYGPFAFNGKAIVGHPSVPEPFRNEGPIDGGFAPISDIPSFPQNEAGSAETGWVYSERPGDYFHYRDDNHRDLLPDEMHAQWAVKKIRQLEQRTDEQPFFLAIGFVRPHTPLYAPKKYFDMFPLEDIELSLRKEGDAKDTIYRKIYPWHLKGLRFFQAIKKSYGGNAQFGIKHFLQAYLACMTFVDDQIGLVIDALENSQFKDNTIIVLISDNGWQMGEKAYLYKNSPWEESTRVPMIIRTPNTAAGTRVSHPVSLIDLYPTLIDLVGLIGDNRKRPSGVALGGYSLKPFLENPNTGDWEGPRGALSMLGYGQNKVEVMKQTYSYRTRDWRYILYADGQEELYDHRSDPYEWHNLAGESNYARIKESLKSETLALIQR